MSTISVRNVRLLWSIGLLAAIAAMAWSLFGFMSSASAQVSEDGTNKPAERTEGSFIKFDGIEGEATDKDHKDWINLLSIGQSITRPSAAGNAGARSRSGAQFDDIVIVKEVDKSTPKLMEAIAAGKVFENVVIHLTRGAEGERVPYLVWELKNVQVTSFSISDSGDNLPAVSISLNYEEIKFVYTEEKEDGSTEGDVEFTWKVEEGKK